MVILIPSPNSISCSDKIKLPSPVTAASLLPLLLSSFIHLTATIHSLAFRTSTAISTKMLPSLYIYRLINPSADGDWHEKPSSTAAFSSSVIDDDSALPFHEHAHLNHAPHPFRPLLCILGYLLAGTAIVATAVFIVIHSARGPSPIPVFPTQTLIFHQEPAYAAPASPSSDALWNANLPGGKGFVLLEDAGKYGLPPGLPSAGGNATGVYGVTWTHEYHCLVSPASSCLP